MSTDATDVFETFLSVLLAIAILGSILTWPLMVLLGVISHTFFIPVLAIGFWKTLPIAVLAKIFLSLTVGK